MDALEIGVFGGVACLYQGLEAQLHQFHNAAAENGLLAEEVGLRLILEGGLHHAAPGAANARGIGEADVIGLAGGVLLHSQQAGHALAVDIGGADGVAGALGGDHQHVHIGGGHNLLEVDVEAVGEHEGVPSLQVGGDVPLVDVRLHLVVDEDHDDIRPFRGLGHGHDLQARRLGGLPVFAALPEADAHVAAGFLQVQGVGVALGAVADDADLLPVQFCDIAVLLIVHFCHRCIPPSIYCRRIWYCALFRWRWSPFSQFPEYRNPPASR